MALSHDKSVVSSPGKGVRDRLLDVAEEFFADRGFDSTSIRDLAAGADCNIASVNYYFGSKENLYAEVWRRHLLILRNARIASIEKVMEGSGGKPGLEDLLRSFARAFVGPFVDKSGSRLITLIAREMINPHLPSSVFGDDVIRPTITAMQKALAQACPDLPKSKVPLVMFSLVGQLVHTIRMRAMSEWTDDGAFAMFEPAKVIDHIVAFSAAGIRGYVGGKTL